MKKILYIIPLLLASLTACQKDEATDTLPTREQLLLTVTDGGYASTDGAQSRATDNDLQTVFEAGDKVGFFSVGKNNALEANNLCMTAKEVNGKLEWEAPAETTLLTADRYFIYYPYQTTLPGAIDPTKTTAAEFFAPVVAAWTPATDQSTQALYTASDLMIGRGVTNGIGPDGKHRVSVTLNHTMGLVFISLPGLTYKFTNNSPDFPAYTLPVSNAKFTGFTPLAMGDDKYRYLIKPSKDNTLQGSFTRNSESRKYSITANVAGGAFKACFVDGGGGTINHTLAIGDFYMKDGTLVSRDATLTDMQKAACLGIVMKVGKDDSGDWVDDCAYKTKGGGTMSSIHGYVLALYDANGGTDNCKWGSIGTKVGTSQQGTTGFYGYKDTQKIKAMNGYSQTTFPAAYWASNDYETRENGKYASPTNSSGWFLPSGGQCLYWVNNRDLLLGQIRQATGVADYNWQYYYWSSSESDNNPSNSAWYLKSSDSEMSWNNKYDNNYHVRSCLVF